MAFQRVQILGNLGKDPDLRYTQSGKAVCNFSVAVTERWNAGGEKKEHTEWFNLVAWDKQAETIAQYFSKGSMIYIEARQRTETYEDKNGDKKTAVKHQLTSFQFVGSKPNGNSSESARPSSGETQLSDDDIPF